MFCQGKDKAVTKLMKNYRRRRGATWISDSCNTTSKAEQLAINFAKNSNGSFATNLFGRCVNKTAKIRAGQTFLETMRDKKRFYLAFEEEICDDYITSNFFEALKLGYIPVVLGGMDIGYDEVALPGTYVDALDYKKAGDLVNYLLYLTKHNLEFFQYVSVHLEFMVTSSTRWACNLGEAWQKRRKSGVVADFKKFWYQKKCYGQYYTAEFH